MREMGAQFQLGWAHLQDIVMNWVKEGCVQNRLRVGVFTYHFSKSDSKLGCRAFDYNTEAAINYAKNLQSEFDEVFQSTDPVGMYSLLLGMETDTGALILHGHNNQIIDLSYENNESENYWLPKLQQLYPSFPKSVVVDLFELVKGNITHIKEVRSNDTLVEIEDLDHAECGLGFGRGFHWLHKPNTIIIVGPFNPNPVDPISTAARLLWENIQKEKVDPNKGIALLTSVPYINTMGFEGNMAVKKAKNNEQLAHKIIRETMPDLIPYIKRLTFTINMKNWDLNILNRD